MSSRNGPERIFASYVYLIVIRVFNPVPVTVAKKSASMARTCSFQLFVNNDLQTGRKLIINSECIIEQSHVFKTSSKTFFQIEIGVEIPAR